MSESKLAAHRIDRLRAAIVRVTDGNKPEFGRRIGYKDGAYVGQMLAGARPISEKTICTIESLHGMQSWFSVDADVVPELQPT